MTDPRQPLRDARTAALDLAHAIGMVNAAPGREAVTRTQIRDLTAVLADVQSRLDEADAALVPGLRVVSRQQAKRGDWVE